MIYKIILKNQYADSVERLRFYRTDILSKCHSPPRHHTIKYVHRFVDFIVAGNSYPTCFTDQMISHFHFKPFHTYRVMVVLTANLLYRR